MDRLTRHLRGAPAVLTAAMATILLAIPALHRPATAADMKTQNTITDVSIVQAIETEIASDGAVPAHGVRVTCRDGIVTLAGGVDNVLASDRALSIARTTRGVRGIVNQLDVMAVTRTDAEIRSDIVDALAEDPATESWEITPTVDDGHVTLTGDVDSWAERDLARAVAAGVRGVKTLENEIMISEQHVRPDAELRNEIQRRLEMDVWVGSGDIDVAVENAVARLSGRVGSVFEKTRATNDAWVPGVRKVDESSLVVDDAVRDRMRRERLATPDDQAIEAAIQDAFLYDPRVNPFSPNIAVASGVVTLTGFVSNLAAKKAAGADARNVVGVSRVYNFIKVRPAPLVGDGPLAERVERALERDTFVHPYAVDVTARNGLVTLTGDVHSAYEKDRAAIVTSRVAGVQEVRNLLDAPTPYDPPAYRSFDPRVPGSVLMKTDAEIEDDIRQQLFWSPFVESDEVQVSVDNGIATLEGTVDDWAERKAARDNAYDGGATGVIDHMQIDYTGP